MRYIVTAERPTFNGGLDQNRLAKGDVVDLNPDETPDEDGDVFPVIVESHYPDEIGMRAHVHVADLTPGSTLDEAAMVSAASVRAALVAVGHEALAEKVLRIAHAVEAAR